MACLCSDRAQRVLLNLPLSRHVPHPGRFIQSLLRRCLLTLAMASVHMVEGHAHQGVLNTTLEARKWRGWDLPVEVPEASECRVTVLRGWT